MEYLPRIWAKCTGVSGEITSMKQAVFKKLYPTSEAHMLHSKILPQTSKKLYTDISAMSVTFRNSVQNSCTARLRGSCVAQPQLDRAICARLVFVGNLRLDACHLGPTCSEEILVTNVVFNI